MGLSEYTMPIGDVARALGVTTERVRQLDAELEPQRIGRYRRYNPAIVQRVLRARQHAATETDDDDVKVATLPPEVRRELDAKCAELLEARRQLEAAALAEDAALANLRHALASRLDSKTQDLFDDRARARKRVLQIGRERKHEGVIYLNDSELDDAQARLEEIDRRIRQRVQVILARLKSSKRARPTPNSPSRPRSRRRRVRATKRARAPAEPEPLSTLSPTRGAP
jgi:hypothetical protein